MNWISAEFRVWGSPAKNSDQKLMNAAVVNKVKPVSRNLCEIRNRSITYLISTLCRG